MRMFALLASCSLAINTRPQQIPAVSFEIAKNRDRAIRFIARFGEKLYSGLAQSLISGCEVIDPQKESNTPCCLIAGRCGLLFPVGTSKKHTGCRTWRANNHPAFGAAVVGERWRVLDEFELQNIHEEPDCAIVVAYDEGDEFEVHWYR